MDNYIAMTARSNELYHHGIKEQQWGIRNGPPYPLSRSGKWTNSEKKYMRDQKKMEKIKKKMEKRENIGSRSYKEASKLSSQELAEAVKRLENTKKYITLAQEIAESSKLNPTKSKKMITKVKELSEKEFDRSLEIVSKSITDSLLKELNAKVENKVKEKKEKSIADKLQDVENKLDIEKRIENRFNFKD